ncbi:MAG: BofC C-terminal domain-containing protein [Clostridia bacterium]|nr:BofC C-terminal domain-containing protein [Clostridia bacterium]MCI2000124.1 BofC C-terminal domain-containing protein [Clostridia bacterium]MCI2014711.1 BofC C-terminal domain-containing protein [Clostridia bacterium]
MEKHRTLYIVLLLIICIAGGFIGYGVGLRNIRNNPVSYNNKINNKENESESEKVSQNDIKITPSTKMVYEYYYPKSGISKVNEEEPPYFMIGLSLNDMKRLYSTWDILSFSKAEVDMRKTMSGTDDQWYIIGEKDGYITIYYDDGNNENSIKEITDIDTNGFSEDEKEQLKKGIRVQGEDALNRALENYSS